MPPSLINLLQGRLVRRTGTVILLSVAVAVTVVVLLASPLSGSSPSNRPPTLHSTDESIKQRVPRCDSSHRTPAVEKWHALNAKYDSLADDRFTISLSTFHRPKELAHVLGALLSEKIPSLLEIVVIWNNLDEPTPAPFTSDHGVSVRYRKPERDSLNEKLRVDGDYRTQAVLLSDDDIYYRPADLEFAFQSWRQFGRHRVTGALARCADLDADGGGWTYAPCRGDAPYSMVLTNLAFVHISFLDFYFTDDVPWLGAVRDAVDSRFNGEDIAVNYVVSLLTGNAPLLVRGSEQYVNLDPAGGISRKPGHFEARSSCLNEYADAMRCMPLVEQEARVERGVRYNVWYKALWDRYTLF